MSLYLKYRPDNLTSVKGNEDILETLTTMLSKPETCPHSFLFHGPTGCGKTTLARIIANELGCVGNDYREVDSADFRGVDSVRDIRKQSIFKPLEGKCRIWVLDECHKMTNDAQNALLKILEDTPNHVYFILCTTDPQKLIAPIKGRCQQFQVKQLNDKQMLRLLRQVVKHEADSIEQEIYDQIIQDSQGHPRNALQILEQVLNSPEDRRLSVAKKAAEEQSQTIELCRILISHKSRWKEVTNILNNLKDQDPENLRRLVLGYMQSILLKEENDRAAMIMECFIEPFYNTGYPGLVFACYQVIKG